MLVINGVTSPFDFAAFLRALASVYTRESGDLLAWPERRYHVLTRSKLGLREAWSVQTVLCSFQLLT